MRYVTRWALLLSLALTLVLAACGGSDTPSATATTASGSQPTSASTTTSADAPTTIAAEVSATSGSGATGGDIPRGKIVVAGAVAHEFTAEAACGGGAVDGDLQALISDASGDVVWLLQVYVNQFKQNGPKDYAVDAVLSTAGASVTISENGLSWSTTSDSEGHVTVNQDGRTGAFEVTAASDDGGQPVTIAGSFVCKVD
jgi:hypothetical protein